MFRNDSDSLFDDQAISLRRTSDNGAPPFQHWIFVQYNAETAPESYPPVRSSPPPHIDKTIRRALEKSIVETFLDLRNHRFERMQINHLKEGIITDSVSL